MLNEFGSYASTLDTTSAKNEQSRKPVVADRYCTNGQPPPPPHPDLSRPNITGPPTSWNYNSYPSSFYNYYANQSYEISDVSHQYNSQKCSPQYTRGYNQPLPSTSVLQCCDPRCQFLSEHSKYQFNHTLANSKLAQRAKRSKAYYNTLLDLPKSETLKAEPSKYTPCVPYTVSQNDLNNKYSNQQSTYSPSQYANAIKPSKHLLLPESTPYSDFYTDVGKPAYWNKQNLWNRNVPTSYYQPLEPEKNATQKPPSTTMLEQNNFVANNQQSRGILFNRLLDTRDRPCDTGYIPNYYCGKQNQQKSDYSGYIDREPVYTEDIYNNTRLPFQNNSYQPYPMYNIHYPQTENNAQTVAVPASSYREPPPKMLETKTTHEKQRILDKNPSLDVREFLSTWDDVEDDKIPENTVGEAAPVIVLDCTTLEGDALAKVKEKLGETITECSPLENGAFQSQNNATVLKVVEEVPLSPHTSVIQGSTATKHASEKESNGDEKSMLESSHMGSDGFLTWYGHSKKKDELSYDLVEMTERLVNTVDKFFNEPEKKNAPKPDVTYHSLEDGRQNVQEKVCPEDEWNINFNYKKKNVEKSLSNTNELATFVQKEMGLNAIPDTKAYPALPSDFQKDTDKTYASVVSDFGKNSLEKKYIPLTANFRKDPTIKACMSSEIDYRKEAQMDNEEKNISCSFNLLKTNSDFKFSMNYSKQATSEYNTSKAQDYSIKYKSSSYQPNDYYKTHENTILYPPKNYAEYDSCCYTSVNYGYNNENMASKEDTMIYVEQIDKTTASDSDITLMKEDLEKSLKEITHQFTYHKQKVSVDKTEDYSKNSIGAYTAGTNFIQNSSYQNNKDILEIGKMNSVLSETVIDTAQMKSGSQETTTLYSGVIQKAGINGSKLCETMQNVDDSNLLSMPSLSPPSTTKKLENSTRTISTVNLTLNDVYENDVIFDTSDLNDKCESDEQLTDERESVLDHFRKASNDNIYQPLNLAMSKESKHETSPSVLKLHKTTDNERILSNNISEFTSIEVPDVADPIFKLDDGYYSIENNNMEGDIDAAHKTASPLSESITPRLDKQNHEKEKPVKITYQTCIVSREQYENSLEKQQIFSLATSQYHEMTEIHSTSPIVEDLSATAVERDKSDQICLPDNHFENSEARNQSANHFVIDTFCEKINLDNAHATENVYVEVSRAKVESVDNNMDSELACFEKSSKDSGHSPSEMNIVKEKQLEPNHLQKQATMLNKLKEVSATNDSDELKQLSIEQGVEEKHGNRFKRKQKILKKKVLEKESGISKFASNLMKFNSKVKQSISVVSCTPSNEDSVIMESDYYMPQSCPQCDPNSPVEHWVVSQSCPPSVLDCNTEDVSKDSGIGDLQDCSTNEQQNEPGKVANVSCSNNPQSRLFDSQQQVLENVTKDFKLENKEDTQVSTKKLLPNVSIVYSNTGDQENNDVNVEQQLSATDFRKCNIVNQKDSAISTEKQLSDYNFIESDSKSKQDNIASIQKPHLDHVLENSVGLKKDAGNTPTPLLEDVSEVDQKISMDISNDIDSNNLGSSGVTNTQDNLDRVLQQLPEQVLDDQRNSDIGSPQKHPTSILQELPLNVSKDVDSDIETDSSQDPVVGMQNELPVNVESSNLLSANLDNSQNRLMIPEDLSTYHIRDSCNIQKQHSDSLSCESSDSPSHNGLIRSQLQISDIDKKLPNEISMVSKFSDDGDSANNDTSVPDGMTLQERLKSHQKRSEKLTEEFRINIDSKEILTTSRTLSEDLSKATTSNDHRNNLINFEQTSELISINCNNIDLQKKKESEDSVKSTTFSELTDSINSLKHSTKHVMVETDVMKFPERSVSISQILSEENSNCKTDAFKDNLINVRQQLPTETPLFTCDATVHVSSTPNESHGPKVFPVLNGNSSEVRVDKVDQTCDMKFSITCHPSSNGCSSLIKNGKCKDKQNLNSKYDKTKLEKRKSMDDIALPMKKRKQDVSRNFENENHVEAKMEILQMNSNIEDDKCFVHEFMKRDSLKCKDDQFLKANYSDSSIGNFKNRKKKRKKDKNKSKSMKKKCKKLKRRFSSTSTHEKITPNGVSNPFDFSLNTYKSCRRSKSLNQFTLDEKLNSFDKSYVEKYPNLAPCSKNDIEIKELSKWSKITLKSSPHLQHPSVIHSKFSPRTKNCMDDKKVDEADKLESLFFKQGAPHQDLHRLTETQCNLQKKRMSLPYNYSASQPICSPYHSPPLELYTSEICSAYTSPLTSYSQDDSKPKESYSSDNSSGQQFCLPCPSSPAPLQRRSYHSPELIPTSPYLSPSKDSSCQSSPMDVCSPYNSSPREMCFAYHSPSGGECSPYIPPPREVCSPDYLRQDETSSAYCSVRQQTLTHHSPSVITFSRNSSPRENYSPYDSPASEVSLPTHSSSQKNYSALNSGSNSPYHSPQKLVYSLCSPPPVEIHSSCKSPDLHADSKINEGCCDKEKHITSPNGSSSPPFTYHVPEITYVEDREPHSPVNYATDDDFFNIPSVAPTPNCDLIKDDNIDYEESNSSRKLDMYENHSKTVPSFNYYTATPNCQLTTEDNLHDDDVPVEYISNSKAPSPNCVLNDDHFEQEKVLNKAPSPCCNLNEVHSDTKAEDISTHDFYCTDLSPISSVAPSPQCDIIEGVLLDDTDISRHADEVNSDVEEQLDRKQKVPTLKNLAFEAVSRIGRNSLSSSGQNLLEIWITPEHTEIIVHSEDQQSTKFVVASDDMSNLEISDVSESTDDPTVFVPSISLNYPTSSETIMNNLKHEDQLQCQCIIISNEKSVICVRCSLISSVVVNEDENMESGIRLSVGNVDGNYINIDKDQIQSVESSDACIEESYIDQNVGLSCQREYFSDNSYDSIEGLLELEKSSIDSSHGGVCKLSTNHKQIKVQLPWHKIFNLNDNMGCDILRELELGPAQIEVRLSSEESDLWKVVNSQNQCPSPVVKVKRLVLQSAASLTNEGIGDNSADSYKADSGVPTSPVTVEVEELKKQSNVTKAVISDEFLGLPRVVIKKTNFQEYRSYLQTNNKLQPIVRLVRSKSLDELALKFCQDNKSDYRINKKNTRWNMTPDWNTTSRGNYGLCSNYSDEEDDKREVADDNIDSVVSLLLYY